MAQGQAALSCLSVPLAPQHKTCCGNELMNEHIVGLATSVKLEQVHEYERDF